jgi:hypothetical protein
LIKKNKLHVQLLFIYGTIASCNLNIFSYKTRIAMLINTQELKRNHPLLSQLPENIWENIFNSSFDDDYLNGTTKRFCECKREELPEHEVQAFIMMMLLFPDISASECLSFAQTILELPTDCIFFICASLGQKKILECIKEQVAKDELLSMIAESDFRSFRWACENGHLPTVLWLVEHNANQLEAMAPVWDYFAFRQAFANRHLDVQKWLLHNAGCFAYAEEHVYEYHEVIQPFVQKIIADLHQAQETFISHQPVAEFSINDPERTKHVFYILRNLIRRNDRTLDGDMRFLLDIPSVRDLAHREVTAGQSNELLRLAQLTDNREASNLLLAIPAVRRLAQQNNFYRDESFGGVDLSRVAQNCESAMTALSQGEARRLDAAIRYYLPQVTTAGVANIMDDLCLNLVNRYIMHPAAILMNGAEVKLPCSYEDFLALNLQGEDLECALRAYYQHKDHSAWRYLSVPNRWMHPQASYVNHSEDGRTHWAMIESFQPLIALLYLAASDTKIPASNGHTLKTRLDHFIDELALLGRAHNWDNTRQRNGKQEAFDDLEGDRPSCWSGVKRRLFQSVIGHPMLDILTEDIIKQEIRDFALAHFKSNINTANKHALKEAFDAVIGMTGDGKALQCLDIPEEKQQEFKKYLSQKYGAAYATDRILLCLVRDSLSLDSNSASVVHHCHAMKLDGLTKLYDYLTQVNEKIPASARNYEFFTPVNQLISKEQSTPLPKKSFVAKISQLFYSNLKVKP